MEDRAPSLSLIAEMPAEAPPPSRPLVRFHGSKWSIADWITSHFPPHRVYVEAFGGSASVLLRKARATHEIYNDIDGRLANLFRVARDRGAELAAAIELTPFSREEFLGAAAPCDDPLEQARRTVVRSFMGRSSNALGGTGTGFRARNHNRTTSPAMDWRRWPGALAATVDRLRGVTIESRDALRLIAEYDTPDTLHYVDPPYPRCARDRGRDYRHEMDDAAHGRLAAALNSARGMVVLSGYDCPLYRDLYEGWVTVSARAWADNGSPRTETLWLRNCAEALFLPGIMEGWAPAYPPEADGKGGGARRDGRPIPRGGNAGA